MTTDTLSVKAGAGFLKFAHLSGKIPATISNALRKAAVARRDVEFLAKAAVMAMQNSLGSQYTSKFIYAPFLLVGLLRWRLKEPVALVAGSDTVADELLQITELVIDDLGSKVRVQPQLRKYHEVLMDVVEELLGQGTNPNLLLDLESLT